MRRASTSAIAASAAGLDDLQRAAGACGERPGVLDHAGDRRRAGRPARGRAGRPPASIRLISSRSDEQRPRTGRAGSAAARPSARPRGRSRRGRRAGASPAIRIVVSGVRSSCETSLTNRCCTRERFSSWRIWVCRLWRHGVERGGQPREVVLAARHHPLVQPPGREPLGDDGRLPHRPHHYRACIPSKSLLRPGEAVQGARDAGARGEVDVEAALAWRDFMVSGYSDAGQERWLEFAASTCCAARAVWPAPASSKSGVPGTPRSTSSWRQGPIRSCPRFRDCASSRASGAPARRRA